MKLSQYNHFEPTTMTIASGQTPKDAYLVQSDSDTVPADYTEISSDIEQIHNARLSGAIDYLTASIKIKNHTGSVGFNTLNALEQSISASYVATDDATLVTYWEGQGLSNADAQAKVGLDQINHANANANACHERFLHRDGADGWFAIILSHYSSDEALKMIDAGQKYLDKYRHYATFGVGYGDNVISWLNFINNDGAITESIEDYTLLSGTDYTQVKADLTEFFLI